MKTWMRSAKIAVQNPYESLASAWYRINRNALLFTDQIIKPLSPMPDPALHRLVLFAHYDPKDEVDDYVRFYLERLYEIGSTIVFVSGSPRLNPASAEKIKHVCAAIFTRRTLSLDFGSWHLAWQQVLRRGWRLEQFRQLILANDSVYGPLFPLSELFDSFTGADMYGVTESNEYTNHLQSYFLAWDLNEKTRGFLERFWADFRYVVLKRDLIDRYEIGISQRARSEGLRLKPYLPDAVVRAAALRRPNAQQVIGQPTDAINNTLRLWDMLIEDFRCPFLKTDLPRRNRYGSDKIRDLQTRLKERSDYDPGLIIRNLERLGIQHEIR